MRISLLIGRLLYLESLCISSLFTLVHASFLLSFSALLFKLGKNLFDNLLVELELGLDTVGEFFVNRILPCVERGQRDVFLEQFNYFSAKSAPEVQSTACDGKRAHFMTLVNA